MRSIVVHAWTLHKMNGQYFLPFTHWVYLKEIVKYFDKVCLLSPVNCNGLDANSFEGISQFENVVVYELPYSKGYIDVIKYFFSYRAAYKQLAEEYDQIYARYPIPFGWLQLFHFRNKKRIIHFVGDPVDTILNNPKLSRVKRFLYTFFFKPEHYLFIQASRRARVFTNGHHLSDRLKKQKISATPLISSTLSESDFFFEDKNINIPRLVYVGYLRKAKGVETILEAFALLQKDLPLAEFTIVGTGELDAELKKNVTENNLRNVFFTGHIDNRSELNEILRNNDIFCFGSLSEGSPRVILEAMANGLAVVSTPVGSLPTTFENNKEILFAGFNNAEEFKSQIQSLCENNDRFREIRRNSFELVKNYRIDNFIKTIFHEA